MNEITLKEFFEGKTVECIWFDTGDTFTEKYDLLTIRFTDQSEIQFFPSTPDPNRFAFELYDPNEE